MPVYSYTKNYLWKEATVMEWISNTQALCDKQWFLHFSKKLAPWFLQLLVLDVFGGNV